MAAFLGGEPLKPDTKNKTVRAFSRLNQSKSFREKSGRFAMEGFRLILDAVLSGVQIHEMLWTEKAYAQYGEAMEAAFSETGNAPDHMLLISEALAKEIADTDTAQGVFAAAEMLPEREMLPQKGDRAMLLHCVQDPSNLGAVLRTAEALGTDGIYLFQCCDLYNPKALRSSMGALFRIPVTRIPDMDAFFAHCRTAGLPTCAAVVDRDADSLLTADFSGGAAVLIGNEGNGLPREVSDACTKRVTIPMAPHANSLNAAMAAGLFLWELRRSRG